MIAYIITVFVLSWGAQIIAIKKAKSRTSEGIEYGKVSSIIMMFVMLMPSLVLLAFVAFGVIVWDWAAFGLIPFNFPGWVLAFFVTILYTVAVFFALKRYSDFPHLKIDNKGRWRIDNIGTLLDKIIPPPKKPSIYIFDILLSIFVSAITLVPLALGEELAWRGFMQPIFIDRIGSIGGILALGLIWGLWHLPMNLAGHNDAKSPKLDAFVFFILKAISLSAVFGWLRIVTGSVWPVAFAHAVNNASLLMRGLVPRISHIKYQIIGTAIYVAFGILGFWLIHVTT